MENYFKMNLPQPEIDAISNLGLAHMGDCVFEILCRGYLCAQGEKTVGQLHHDTIQMVKATSQAKFAAHLGAFSSENSINEQTVDFTGFSDFSAEKNYQRGMWITLWILWINRLLAFPEMWKLWISLWKNSEQLWNTWEFPVEGVCKSDY